MNHKLKIVSKRELSSMVYELVLQGDLVQSFHTSGQFIHIKAPRNDLILRRPISLANIDHASNTCSIVLRSVGQGTQSIIESKVGDFLDVIGPLGNGFPIDSIQENDQVLLMGGGIGVPPLLECAKQLKERGASCTIVLGFLSKEAVFYEEEFKQYGDVYISTDDGSYLTHGNVKTILDTLNQEFAGIYACGPKGLVRMVNQVYEKHPQAYISLEERMACGVGACAGCTVNRKDGLGNLKVCSDGPVFRTGEVIV